MQTVAAFALAAILAQPTTSGIHQLTYRAADGSTVLYAVSVPRGYDPRRPAPLVLVLHSGGERMRYYGAAFTRLLVEPALGPLQAIMLAPDCPTNSWTDPAAEEIVMALLQQTLENYAIDRRRVLVTGFSMGGRGTWFMSARHPDLFTAAIPMAASVGDEPLDRLGTMPTYVIHSRADQVVPFAPAERLATELRTMGREVRFEALDDFGHFEMFRYVDALKRAGQWVAKEWSNSGNVR